MALKESDRDALEIAANLCNLGKLSIPQALLTKTEPLTAEERAVVKNEVQRTREILQNIEFDGPVLETILQNMSTWMAQALKAYPVMHCYSTLEY